MNSDVTSLAQKKFDEALGLSRYRVDIHDCSHFLDVLRFRASETLSQPWHYDVTFTCAASIASNEVMLKPASFTFQTPFLMARRLRRCARYTAWWIHSVGSLFLGMKSPTPCDSCHVLP